MDSKKEGMKSQLKRAANFAANFNYEKFEIPVTNKSKAYLNRLEKEDSTIIIKRAKLKHDLVPGIDY